MFSPNIYLPLYLTLVTILTLFASQSIKRQSAYQLQHTSIGIKPISAIVLCVILGLFMGSRPPTYAFGDTGNYVFIFEHLRSTGFLIKIPDGEWVWTKFMEFCIMITDAQGFLTLHDFLYLGCTALACFMLMPRHIVSAFLFNLAALSFFTYGTNGMRNGLACSLMLIAIAVASLNSSRKLIAIVIAFFAYNIHHSTMLPFGMMIISMYFIKSYRWAYTFWILSILISLVAGGAVTSIFAGLGFDNRLQYLTTQASASEFTHTGFRFDFLIYSMMPIILGYYIIIKKGIRDKTYELLLNTYTLTNAFWVMVIRANFSNRFAYLSWFLYPIVLAYPLFKLNVWGDRQGEIASKIMLAHLGFTLFMDIVYW